MGWCLLRGMVTSVNVRLILHTGNQLATKRILNLRVTAKLVDKQPCPAHRPSGTGRFDVDTSPAGAKLLLVTNWEGFGTQRNLRRSSSKKPIANVA